MKVIIAQNIGFCSGVKRAIAIADKSTRGDPKPIQFLGDLVHNENVTKAFKKKGVKFIKNPQQAHNGTIIIRAHGISPLSRINKKLCLEDATCFLVKKAQQTAKALFNKGYKVIIIGDKNHPEVKGIKGFCKNKAITVSSELKAKRLKRYKKIGVIAQTTQNSKFVFHILKMLRKKCRELKWVNTLCPEVLRRQKEIIEILKKVQAIIVVGSASSANTKRLVEIANNNKKSVFRVNSLAELKKKNIKRYSSIGVVSGTSAPDWEIKKIIKYLTNLAHDKKA